MCRIAGIIDKNQNTTQIQKDIKAMCDAMAHGGPDGEGFFYDEGMGLGFGHRRLALIDLSPTGSQPMKNKAKDLVITFNGEIYNYLDLKAELVSLGYQFNTESDTEVILTAYQAWKEECFCKLKGMFAFGLYDIKKQVTYLVRDQMGIKPMYYSSSSGRLVFASEVKAFKRNDYPNKEDLNWKIYFLAFGHIPHPFTTLKNVQSLSPGHFLKWDHRLQKSETFCFEKQASKEIISNKKEAELAIAQSLTKSVQRHLIADAPVGVFLSGGIDSSLITLLADQAIAADLKTLAINFAEKEYSEERFQRLIAREIQAEHHSYQVQEEDLLAHFEQIIKSMDQPTTDGINSWFINKYAKENGLKGVLSGIGADELFGGYPSFKRMGLIRKLKKLPRFILRLSEHLPSERLKRISFLSYSNPIGEYLFLRGFFTLNQIAKILGIDRRDIDQLIESFPVDWTIERLTGKKKASWLETHLFMQNQLLKDTDTMSMAHGVEVRVPFLDQDFIATSKRLTNAQRFGNRPKGILIDSFKNLLPEAIWKRPKMGFTFPLQQWLVKNERITDERLYKDEALKLIRNFSAGKLHWSKALALYQVNR